MALGRIKKDWEQKKKRRQNQGQMDMAKLNRESAQKLMHALQLAEVKATGIQTKEGREVFKDMTRNLMSFLDNSGVIARYDVAEIDKLLLEIIELYGEALGDGDLETAKHGVERIHAGLVGFRKELSASETERQEEVLAERITILGEYKTVLATSRKIFINRKNVEDKEKEYLSQMKEYEELYETVERQTKERPDLYRSLQELRPGIDEVLPEAAEMHTNIERLTQMADQVDDLKQAMQVFRSQFNSQQSELKSLLTTLSIKDGLLTDEDKLRMEEAVDRYQSQLQKSMLEVRELEKIQERRHLATRELFNSMSHGMAIVRHMRKYEDLKRRHQLKQEGIEEGTRQINEEQVNKQEAHKNSQNILN